MATFETIKLDKGLYSTGKGLLYELEKIDPSENYKGTPLKDLDAFERQLKRFDIKVNGANSDTIEKFFKTPDSAILFPEYVARVVQQGIEKNNAPLNDIIATKTNIKSFDYRTISVSDFGKEPKKPEDGFIPETVVNMQENLARLKKYGRMLVASYEAIRFQRIDLFTITLNQIGAYIYRAQFKDAVDTLLNDTDKHNITTLSHFYESLLPHRLNTIIMPPRAITPLKTVPDFLNDPYARNINFIASYDVENKLIIGLDKTCALEMVTAGGVQTDYNSLIDRQFERSAITQTTGFSKIFTDAVKVMKL